ncbi:MAG: hypothetical protein RCG15_02845 [Candidatus Rickettsia vulgarisii]
MTLLPEAYAVISQILNKKRGKLSVILQGMSTLFINRPDRAGKTLYNLGTGVTIRKNNIEYAVSYDAYLAKKYISHQGALKLRVNL